MYTAAGLPVDALTFSCRTHRFDGVRVTEILRLCSHKDRVSDAQGSCSPFQQYSNGCSNPFGLQENIITFASIVVHNFLTTIQWGRHPALKCAGRFFPFSSEYGHGLQIICRLPSLS